MARSTTFRWDLLLELLSPYHIISADTGLQAATQLEVACLLVCVFCDEHLAIYRPIYTAAMHLAAQ